MSVSKPRYYSYYFLFLLLLLIHKFDESHQMKLLFTSRLARQERHHNEAYFKIIRWYSPYRRAI